MEKMNRNWKKRLKSFFLDGNKHILFFGVSVIPSYMIGLILSGILPPENTIPVTVFVIGMVTIWTILNVISLSKILFKTHHKYDEDSQNLKEIKYERKKKTVARWDWTKSTAHWTLSYGEFQEEGKKLISLLDTLVQNKRFTKEESVQVFHDIPQEFITILQNYKKLDQQRKEEMKEHIQTLFENTHHYLTDTYMEPMQEKWETECKEKIQNLNQSFGEKIYIRDEC